MTTLKFDIYYDNLDQMTQEELCKEWKTTPEEENWDAFPLATIEREEEEEKAVEKGDYLKEVCKNCGLTFGAHHGGTSPYPRNYCPGNEGRMNWEEGRGTVFSPSGLFFEVKYDTRWSYPIGGSDETKEPSNLANTNNP